MLRKIFGQGFRPIYKITLCLLCVIVLTVCWFNYKDYNGGAMHYQKKLIIGNTGATVLNYLGTVADAETGEIVYDTPLEANVGFTLDTLYPGARQQFKTVVLNEQEGNLVFSVCLTEMGFDTVLKDYISLSVTAPDDRSFDCRTDAVPTETGYAFRNAVFTDQITLKPQEQIEIYWNIGINREAGNECVGAKVTLAAIQLQN